MPKTQPISPTPILDLELPLPIPEDWRVTGRFAVPFLSFIIFICWIDNIAFLIVPVGILLIGFLSTLVHEAGHVAAGLLAGLRFDGVVIGPFVFKRRRNGWRFRVRPRISQGMAYMSFSEIRRIRHRELICVAGGPVSSLLCGIIALVGGEFARGVYDSPWPTFFEFFGIYSIFIGILSLLPYYVGHYAGDGLLLRTLLGIRPGTRQLIAAHALAVLNNKNPESPSLHPRWTKLAYGQAGLTPVFHHNWYLFSVSKDSEKSSEFLEGCLAYSGILERDERDALIAEVVVFSAWQRNDLEKGRRWLARIRKPNQLPKLATLRMNAVIATVSGNFKSALEYADLALKTAEGQSAGPGAEDFVKSWRDWKSEIQKRSIAALETVEATA